MLTRLSSVLALRWLETVVTESSCRCLGWRDYLNDGGTRNLQTSSHVNCWTNGKRTPAAGQTVKIMVQVSDTPFVPTGHDQITASFFFLRLGCASAPQLGEGRITVFGACCNSVLVMAVTMPQTEGWPAPPVAISSPVGALTVHIHSKTQKCWAVRMLRRHCARLSVAWSFAATDEHLSVIPDALWLKTWKWI